MTLPDFLLGVEATVEENFGGQLHTQHPQVFSSACAAVTETTFTRNWHYFAPSCIYFSVSDVSTCT